MFTAGTDPVTARETLVESDALPFALYLVPGSGGSDFHLVAEVTTAASVRGARRPSSSSTCTSGTWYTADLVYDTDTLASSSTASSIRSTPSRTGRSPRGTGDQLVAGHRAAALAQFNGAMAALQLHDDIPIELEAQLDERRSHPQWYLT